MSSSHSPALAYETPSGTGHGSGHDAGAHADPLMSYIAVFVALLVLLAMTVGAYYLPFEKWFGDNWGFLNTMVALIIASVKASLVMLVFMHLRHGTRLTWVIAVSGFMWLCIMVTFTFSDYLTRNSISKEPVRQPNNSITHPAQRDLFVTPSPD